LQSKSSRFNSRAQSILSGYTLHTDQRNFAASGLKFTIFFVYRGRGGIVVDQVCLPLSISGLIPETYAMKVKSFIEIAPSFGRFLLCEILGGGAVQTL